MTSIAPESTASSAAEPTLAEAFGDLAAGIVEMEDGGSPTTSAPSDRNNAPAPSIEKGASPAPNAAAAKPSETPAPAAKPGAEPTASPGTEPGEDPLAGSKPLTYAVDGEIRTMDGVHEYEGGGAVILADALPKIKDRLQQADRLVAQNRALYDTTQEFQRLGGAQAFAALQAEKAVLDASGTILLRALTDPNMLVTLATDPAAREMLVREIRQSAREAHSNAREQFQTEATQFTAQRNAAGQTQTAIGNAVSQLARSFEGLTTEDVQAVRSHALRVQSAIVRPANPDEARAAGVRVGESIIDLPTLHSFLADRHALRQGAVAQARRDAEAARDNAATLAAARPTAPGAPGAPRPGAGKQTPKPNGGKTLDTMTSAELTRAMKTGKIFDLIGAGEE